MSTDTPDCPQPVPPIGSLLPLPVDFATHGYSYCRPVHEWCAVATSSELADCCTELARLVGGFTRHHLTGAQPGQQCRVSAAVFHLPYGETVCLNDLITDPEALDDLAWWERYALLLVTYAAHSNDAARRQLNTRYLAGDRTSQIRALRVLYTSWATMPEDDTTTSTTLAAPSHSHPGLWSGWVLRPAHHSAAAPRV